MNDLTTDEEQYLGQLNAARREVQGKLPGAKGRLAAKAIGKVSGTIVDKLVKAIQDKEKAWLLILMIAILNDLLDFIIEPLADAASGIPAIGLILAFVIKAIGIAIDYSTILILYAFTTSLSATGPALNTRIKWLLAITGLTEITPAGIVPLWAINIIWTRHKVNQRAAKAEKGLKQIEKGRLDPDIQQEFAH